MGNVIGSPLNSGKIGDSSDGTLDSSNPVADYIKKWALANYKIGNNNDQLYSSTLQKRGCCTGQTSVPIPMIGIYDDHNTKTSSMMSYNLLIPVLPLNDANCTLTNANNKDNYRLGIMTTDGSHHSPLVCDQFYKQFASDLLKSRKDRYVELNNNTDNILYGDLPEIVNSKTNNVNSFSDCNCINSIFNICNTENPNTAICQGFSLGSVSQNGTSINGYTLAQNIDKRCNYDTIQKYNPSINLQENICLNISNVNDAKISGAGNSIVTSQTCNQNNITGTPSTGTPSTGTPSTGTPSTGTPSTETQSTGTVSNLLLSQITTLSPLVYILIFVFCLLILVIIIFLMNRLNKLYIK
jgi:hypothetical protein